jgi:hypothetical protein
VFRLIYTNLKNALKKKERMVVGKEQRGKLPWEQPQPQTFLNILEHLGQDLGFLNI